MSKEILLAIFFDTVAHRDAGYTALKGYFSDYPRLIGAVEGHGKSGGDGFGTPQLWASLDVPDDLWENKRAQLLQLIRNNAATFGVTAMGCNGNLVAL